PGALRVRLKDNDCLRRKLAGSLWPPRVELSGHYLHFAPLRGLQLCAPSRKQRTLLSWRLQPADSNTLAQAVVWRLRVETSRRSQRRVSPTGRRSMPQTSATGVLAEAASPVAREAGQAKREAGVCSTHTDRIAHLPSSQSPNHYLIPFRRRISAR